MQAYFIPLAIAPPVPPYLPQRQLLAFQRVRVPAGGSAPVVLQVTSEVLVLTDSAGRRAPAPGTYRLLITRGPANTDDLTLAATISLGVTGS
jgi:hypothetical protein